MSQHVSNGTSPYAEVRELKLLEKKFKFRVDEWEAILNKRVGDLEGRQIDGAALAASVRIDVKGVKREVNEFRLYVENQLRVISADTSETNRMMRIACAQFGVVVPK